MQLEIPWWTYFRNNNFVIVNNQLSFLNIFIDGSPIAVLSYGIDTIVTNVTLNSSVVAETCGANFCGVSAEIENPNLVPPPVERIHIISGIYLACMILACLIIAVAVDSLSRYSILHLYFAIIIDRYIIKYLYHI